MTRIDTLPELANLLSGTFLAPAKIIELEIPTIPERAFAIEIEIDNAIAAWELLHSYLDRTQRYPVIVSGDEYPKVLEDWEKTMRDSYLFCNDESHNPAMAIETALSVDLDLYVEEKNDDFAHAGNDDLEELWRRQLHYMEETLGIAPARSEINLAIDDEDTHKDVKIQRYLLDWAIANCSDDREEISPHNWREAIDLENDDFFSYRKHLALVLLPTANSWEALAYLDWYGSEMHGIDVTIAFFKRWYDRYRAELVCSSGTLLYIKTGKFPTDLQTAFDLALEHFALSSYSVQNPLWEDAFGLMGWIVWYFHERP